MKKARTLLILSLIANFYFVGGISAEEQINRQTATDKITLAKSINKNSDNEITLFATTTDQNVQYTFGSDFILIEKTSDSVQTTKEVNLNNIIFSLVQTGDLGTDATIYKNPGENSFIISSKFYRENITGGQTVGNEGNYSTMISGKNNYISNKSNSSVTIGGYKNKINGTMGIIIDGQNNKITENGQGLIIGGSSNTANNGSIFQGYQNTVNGGNIFGGEYNTTYAGEIFGGYNNITDKGSESNYTPSFIFGGFKNEATNASEIYGGDRNTAKNSGFIFGGIYNVATNNSMIVGGMNNKADNIASQGRGYNLIVGGLGNTLNWNAESSEIFGGGSNIIYNYGAEIFGGGSNIIYDDNAEIFGGSHNKIRTIEEISEDTLWSLDENYSTTIFGGYNNIASGRDATILGGRDSIVGGEYAVGIGGGSTSADNAIAVGYQSASTTANGLALGYQAIQSQDGTISFGHDKGDFSKYNIEWKKDTDGNIDYSEDPTVTKETYDEAYYNRLVKVADGIEDHDVATVGQVKKLVAKSGGGAAYTAGTDIVISDENQISVAKTGQISSNNTGLVTGDTVYQVTNKLNNDLTDQGKSITAANNKITSLNKTIETIRKNMVEMNTSVSNTIADLPSSLGNFINKDLSNLSTDGQNTLKALIKSEIKNQMGASASNSVSAVSTMNSNFMVQAAADTSYVDNAVAGKADKAELNKIADTVATKADKKDLDALATKVDTKADKTYVDTELAKKADQSTVDAISTKVDTNAKNIASNSEAIKGNTSAIADLKENKADVSGANIDIASWSEKLGTGKVASGDAGLVTGGTVFSALEQKADIGYVNAGFQSMGAQIQEMNQSLTRDINKVGAGAAALAGLHPQEYDPNNKLDFAVGYGHYHNANATALGMYYRPNGVTTLSLAGTIGNGDPMLSAGLSFKLGSGGGDKKVILTQKEYIEMRQEMEDMKKAIQLLLQQKPA